MRIEFILIGIIIASILVIATILRYAVKERGCRCLECRAEHLTMSNRLYDIVSIAIFILFIMAAIILLRVPAPEINEIPIGAEAKYIPKNFHQILSNGDHLQNCKVPAP